jgi:hypothetical protein
VRYSASVPLAPVSVDIAPPGSRDDHRQALLDACSRAARGTTCIEDGPGAAESHVVAIVSWRDPSNVRLEVALRSEQKWLIREIHFENEDPPLERWRAVGLVIGTLASVMTFAEEQPPTPEPAPAEPPPPPPRPEPATALPATARSTEPTRRRAWLEAGTTLGSALNRGPVALGAEIAGRLRLFRSLYGSAGIGYSRGLGNVSGVRTVFMDAFVGIAYEREFGERFALVLRADGFVERFEPSLAPDSAFAAAPTSGERVLGGARAGADVFYWGAHPVGFFLGGTGRVVSGATDVRAYGNVVAAAPVLGGAFRAGVAFEFR